MKEQIIDCDKIYHHTLKLLGYTGTFWEILKKEPKEIPNIQEIWNVHKLRNSLVHGLWTPENKILERESQRYLKILRSFIRSVTQ